MMGPRQEAQSSLFYEFSMENHVPQDHLLRSIDRFADLSSIRAHLADFYSHTGRPSVDPELLIRMLLVGYCFGIRSERRLCEEVHLNLAYRWFCRLDLNERIPDHSTFSKNRHGRFRESELLRHLFETTVARCIEEGLVSGQRMAVDASLIEADANKQNSTPKEEWDASAIDPADAPRAVREYLDTLDEAAFGAASEVQPKFTSHSDPASQWTAARKGPAFFSYSDNYLIDTDSLKRNALARSSDHNFPRLQHVVFQQNGREVCIRCGCKGTKCRCQKRTFTSHASGRGQDCRTPSTRRDLYRRMDRH